MKGMTYACIKREIRCPLLKHFRWKPIKKFHRIMVYISPQDGIQVTKYIYDFGLPCPVKISRQPAQLRSYIHF
jgi:hypothetical protein